MGNALGPPPLAWGGNYRECEAQRAACLEERDGCRRDGTRGAVDLADCRNAAEGCERARARLGGQVGDCQRSTATCHVDRRRLTEERDDCRRLQDRTEADRRAWEARWRTSDAARTAEAEACRQRVEALGRSGSATQADNERLQGQLDAAVAARTLCEGNHGVCTAAKDALGRQKATCDTDLTACTTAKDLLKGQKATCDADLTACTTAKDLLKGQKATCDTDLTACTTAKDLLKGQKATCDADLTACTTAKDLLKGQKATCDADLLGCQNARKLVEGSLTTCQADRDDQSTKRQRCESDLEACTQLRAAGGAGLVWLSWEAGDAVAADNGTGLRDWPPAQERRPPPPPADPTKQPPLATTGPHITATANGDPGAGGGGAPSLVWDAPGGKVVGVRTNFGKLTLQGLPYPTGYTLLLVYTPNSAEQVYSTLLLWEGGTQGRAPGRWAKCANQNNRPKPTCGVETAAGTREGPAFCWNTTRNQRTIFACTADEARGILTAKSSVPGTVTMAPATVTPWKYGGTYTGTLDLGVERSSGYFVAYDFTVHELVLYRCNLSEGELLGELKRLMLKWSVTS